MKRILFLTIFVCYFPFVQAQDFEVGGAIGTALYSGDLAPDEFGVYFETLNPSAGVFLRLNAGQAFAGRISLNYARIGGDDLNGPHPDRGLSFRSDIVEFALTAELDLFRIGYPDVFQVEPYLFGGVAAFRFNPQTQFEGRWIPLQPLGTEGQGLEGYDAPYDLFQVAIPMGGGLKIHFNSVWTLGFEFGGRLLSTDYLDDVGTTDVNYNELLQGNGPLAAQLSNPSIENAGGEDIVYRRGGDSNDWYYIGSVTLSYHFGSGGGYGHLPRQRRGNRELGCPKF